MKLPYSISSGLPCTKSFTIVNLKLLVIRYSSNVNLDAISDLTTCREPGPTVRRRSEDFRFAMAAKLFLFVTDGGANKLGITFSGGTRDSPEISSLVTA
jgi:hypothetical protein